MDQYSLLLLLLFDDNMITMVRKRYLATPIFFSGRNYNVTKDRVLAASAVEMDPIFWRNNGLMKYSEAAFMEKSER